MSTFLWDHTSVCSCTQLISLDGKGKSSLVGESCILQCLHWSRLQLLQVPQKPAISDKKGGFGEINPRHIVLTQQRLKQWH